MREKVRVVFDCNTLVQAVGSPEGPAGRCVQFALQGRILLIISPVVLTELREALRRPKLMAEVEVAL